MADLFSMVAAGSMSNVGRFCIYLKHVVAFDVLNNFPIGGKLHPLYKVIEGKICSRKDNLGSVGNQCAEQNP
jgi:hypothetical protein